MLIKEYEGHKPNLHPTVRVAENAVIVGKATLEADVNVWYSAVIRADGDEIFIGARSNIQDAAVLHCDSGSPIHLGENVVVGHGAIVHSCTVGDNSLIGMGATLLSGCKIGSGCIVGAGAVVAGNMTVPDNAMVVGLPGKVLKPTTGGTAGVHRGGRQALRGAGKEAAGGGGGGIKAPELVHIKGAKPKEAKRIWIR